MSTKYPGGFITKSPVAPTSSAASGIWTLDQQQQAQKAGTWPSPPIFIEDLFSTYLYTGNGSTQTITNGIDLAGQGGLTILKNRSTASYPFFWWDSARGNYVLLSDRTDAQYNYAGDLVSFNSNGFSLGSPTNTLGINNTNATQVSWTFRKQPKFFDVVTYTGNGTSGLTVPHNLGSVPGCIIVKSMTSIVDWAVYHTSLGATKFLNLNLTNAATTGSSYWNDVTPTSTNFTVGNSGRTNGNGESYVAYLFANDAGGFPVSGGGSTNAISCGGYTGTGAAGNTITLGYEPQWILIKRTDSTSNWYVFDVMRGMPVGGTDVLLAPNLTDGDNAIGSLFSPTATGFTFTTGFAPVNASAGTYIYIAIRRGPMKTPTVGTSVFAPLTYTGNGTSGRLISGAGFPPDLLIQTARSTSENREFDDRLRGGGSTAMNALFSNLTNAEAADSGSVQLLNQDGFTVRSFGNGSSVTYIGECFRRAPGFFDEVCATCPSSGDFQITHNLSVVPEFVITKSRSNTNAWNVYHKDLGRSLYLNLNDTIAQTTGTNYWNVPTTTTFGTPVGIFYASGWTAVFYMFATVAGVSKVGSYTGTGALLTVNCGFTSGARFVLIKRTDSTGDWFTYDSARGITSGNDPYLLMNSTAAEVTGTNYVDTDTTGFQVTAAAPAGLNANGGTYIFLAIA
jgi:hypothetical protein